ncbi:hypothetical protein [Streptosporangium saharense]|uniref:hypothetical protein n=1 Tax=Streptosporangium saharense TaxID=1706840 RepID=UPI0033337740
MPSPLRGTAGRREPLRRPVLTATTEGEPLVAPTVPEEYRSPGDGVLLPVHPYNFGFVIGRPREDAS